MTFQLLPVRVFIWFSENCKLFGRVTEQKKSYFKFGVNVEYIYTACTRLDREKVRKPIATIPFLYRSHAIR